MDTTRAAQLDRTGEQQSDRHAPAGQTCKIGRYRTYSVISMTLPWLSQHVPHHRPCRRSVTSSHQRSSLHSSSNLGAPSCGSPGRSAEAGKKIQGRATRDPTAYLVRKCCTLDSRLSADAQGGRVEGISTRFFFLVVHFISWHLTHSAATWASHPGLYHTQ